MRQRIVIDAVRDWNAEVEQLERAALRGEQVEAELVSVQPRFSRHIAQFTSKAARDAWRAERSRQALAPAAERLARAGIPFRTVQIVGEPDRSASRLECYWIPAGVAGLAALIAAPD
ncbi:MAG TPA: hypothetical protein VMT02_04910 [Burkholderiales bacterium]|jgi:hypothetical protein|nr:hypothetical protein [Burkholderiales bacterium]